MILTSTQKLQALIEQYRALPENSAEIQKKIDKKFRLEFNYNSNHLEGSTLTYDETETILLLGDTTGNHSLREWNEMQAHDMAFKIMQELASDKNRVLTEQVIKELNTILLVEPFQKAAITFSGDPSQKMIQPGQYKTAPNSVELPNKERFEYASPAETPILMGELIQWLREEEDLPTVSIVERAALFHYRFVRIHPFDDGNGRIARLLMNYIILREGLPPIVIKSSDKSSYLFALRQADIGHTEKFVEYISEQLTWSLNICIKAAKQKTVDEPGDLEKKLALLKRERGYDANAEVQYTRGPEAIRLCFEIAITPLMQAWEEMLKRFDPFFGTRAVHISIPGGRTSLPSAVRAFEEFARKIVSPKLDKYANFGDITMQTTLMKFRESADEANFHGGEILIVFEQNLFKVKFVGTDKRLSKLYHEKFSERELSEVFEEMGNWIYKNMEEMISRQHETPAR